jgi:hypothetical protein
MIKIFGRETESNSAELRKNVIDVDWASCLIPYHHLKPKEKIGMPNQLPVFIDCSYSEFL